MWTLIKSVQKGSTLIKLHFSPIKNVYYKNLLHIVLYCILPNEVHILSGSSQNMPLNINFLNFAPSKSTLTDLVKDSNSNQWMNIEKINLNS